MEHRERASARGTRNRTTGARAAGRRGYEIISGSITRSTTRPSTTLTW